MKIVITGSRGWVDMDKIHNALLPYVGVCTSLIQGGARGADKMAAYWAYKLKIPVHPTVVPEWEIYGKMAGKIRNEEMVDMLNPENGDIVLAFWDGSSPGTKHCMEYARKKGIPVVEN